MQVEEIFISETVEDKLLSKHGIIRDEIEDLFWYSDDKPIIRRTREDKYIAFGRSLEGRYLVAVFARTGRGTIRIVTARDMTKAERQQYKRGSGT